MDDKTISDRELDNLLAASGRRIEDAGFSRSVIKRLNRRKIISWMIPIISGSIGAMITFTALPKEWLPSIILRLTDPVFDLSRSQSNEMMMFLASYGIEPSLIWIFLAVPLFILPFALQHE